MQLNKNYILKNVLSISFSSSGDIEMVTAAFLSLVGIVTAAFLSLVRICLSFSGDNLGVFILALYDKVDTNTFKNGLTKHKTCQTAYLECKTGGQFLFLISN